MKKTFLKYILLFILLGFTLGLNGQNISQSGWRTDTISVTVQLPLEASDVKQDPNFKTSVAELFEEMNVMGMELCEVLVYGAASPDGTRAYNEYLSCFRADNAASYITDVMGVEQDVVRCNYVHEDWSLLTQMILASELNEKYSIISAIAVEDYELRKSILRAMNGGRIWDILIMDFFPALRYVRIDLVGNVSDVCEMENLDIRNTGKQEVLVDEQPDRPYANAEDGFEDKVYGKCWRFAVKTNLLADAVAIPSLGMEFQAGEYLSFEISGNIMAYNVFASSYKDGHFYNVSPEFRYWLGGRSMQKGHFFGVHGNYAFYSMQMPDGLIYQNGYDSIWDGIIDEGMSVEPAWSAGLTYGYSFGFGDESKWGLELFVGAGYLSTVQDISSYSSTGNPEIVERQRKYGIGLTKAGVNLTYRIKVL